jgi:hypothetical protein
MSDQKYGEMITDEEIGEAVDTLSVVAQRFLKEGCSVHLQCYRTGEVFVGLYEMDDAGEDKLVSLHESFQAAIDKLMRIQQDNSPKIPEGSK